GGLGVLLLATQLAAATRTVQVGPSGTLTFVDDASGTSTTTITAGDSVTWVWQSSGHSTTRNQSPETWDSGVQFTPFTFTHRFLAPGTYRYHCTPHEIFGMVGTVVVLPAGGGTTTTTVRRGTTTTTTVPPPVTCSDPEAVASTRAEIETRCPCSAASTHAAYLRCAAGVMKDALKAHALPGPCKHTVRMCAAKSTCGRPESVTCCRTNAAGRTACSVKRGAAACRRPRRGTACTSTRPSCCEACSGAGCAP
ncbi:MAG: hypothetical protein E6J83_14105, partial [Deltaproteobacteria bacterium]